MSEYNIDSINLLISQLALKSKLQPGDVVYVDGNSLPHIVKELYKNAVFVKVDKNFEDNFTVKVIRNSSDGIFRNIESMNAFLHTKNDGIKNIVLQSISGELHFQNKAALVEHLNGINNNEFMDDIRNYLDATHPEVHEKYNKDYTAIIESI